MKRAKAISENSKVSSSAAGQLGLAMGELANNGKDKLTFIISPQIHSFGSWIEQLIAESTGKNGKGILPVEGESLEKPEFYSGDRVFIYIHLSNEQKEKIAVEKLSGAGFPFIEIILEDLYDLGEQYFIWEMATSVAGWKLGIQPFNQPDVESAKVLARQMMKEYQENGKLPEQIPLLKEGKIKLYGEIKINSISEAIKKFIEENLSEVGYVSLQAYIKPGIESSEQLQVLRTKIQKKYKVAATVGYGPRFLHSTGQLHKGDGGNGLFIQFTSSSKKDLEIPENPGEKKSSITFGTLINAQALGDRKALLNKGRKVLHFDLGNDINGGLKYLLDSI